MQAFILKPLNNFHLFFTFLNLEMLIPIKEVNFIQFHTLTLHLFLPNPTWDH